MAATRSEKDLEIAALGEQFSKSVMALCADYRGLTVEEITILRRDLKRTGASGRVVKNTLAKISIEKALADADKEQLAKLIDLFEGPNFVVFADEDAAAPAKVLSKFAKEHEALEIRGGFFEGEFIDIGGIKQLSDLPSREELLSKLLSVFQAPATKVVQILNAPANKLVQTLEAYRAKLEQEQ